MEIVRDGVDPAELLAGACSSAGACRDRGSARCAAGRPMSSRLVTMYWPQWPIRAAGIGAGEPAVVVRGHRVIAVSEAAAEAGITLGLRRREAQARCPGVQVLAEDADRDARRFEPVVRAVAALVPLVEVSAPGLLTCAARGPSRYFGGDAPLADRLVEAADPSSCGLPADAVVGCGIADGRFASTIAAHRALAAGRPEVVPAGPRATADLLAPLPLAALSRWGEVDEGLVDLLHRLGLRSLGAFADLPRTDVLARFGAPGGFAHQLASGDDPRAPDAHEPPPDLAMTHWCEDPIVQIEPLVFIGRQLAAGLHRRLADHGAVVTRLVIEAQTEHGESSERQWYRPLGFGVAAIVERIRWQLDGWSRLPGGLSGGVVFLRLTPVEIRADRGMQLGFWGGTSEADEAAARAAARLVGMLGPEFVRVPVVRDGARWRVGAVPGPG